MQRDSYEVIIICHSAPAHLPISEQVQLCTKLQSLHHSPHFPLWPLNPGSAKVLRCSGKFSLKLCPPRGRNDIRTLGRWLLYIVKCIYKDGNFVYSQSCFRCITEVSMEIFTHLNQVIIERSVSLTILRTYLCEQLAHINQRWCYHWMPEIRGWKKYCNNFQIYKLKGKIFSQ